MSSSSSSFISSSSLGNQQKIITLISVFMNFLKTFSSQKQKDGLYPPHDEGSFVFFSAFFSFSSSCESSRTKENYLCEHHPP
jgi:hypothetical protein